MSTTKNVAVDGDWTEVVLGAETSTNFIISNPTNRSIEVYVGLAGGVGAPDRGMVLTAFGYHRFSNVGATDVTYVRSLSDLTDGEAIPVVAILH